MKFSRLAVIFSCLCLVCSLYSGVVFGLDTNDATVDVTFSDETPSQGKYVTVTVTLTNLASNELEIYYFGLHFDWMNADQFAGHDLSDNPVTVQAGGAHTFSPVTIQVPSTATVGTHSYFVGMDGYEGGLDVFSWDSPTGVIVVQDSWQDVYTDLLEEVENNISIAEHADYKSPEAQGFLDQAQNAYSQALDYAADENWQSAIASLQSVSVSLEQAETEEQNYVEPEPEQDLTLIIVGVSVTAVVIIAVLLVMLRRKPKTSSESV